MNDFDEMLEWAEAANTQRLVIRQHGDTLIDECWHGADATTTTDIASMQKCLAAIVIGQLAAEGALDLDAPLSTYLGEGWSRCEPATEHAITIRHILTMRSGLNDTLAYDTAPGGDWYYCNVAYHQVRKALEVITGLECEPLFAERLWRPLGMTSTQWRSRPQMVDPNGWVLSGVHTTATDMVRFGQAVLDRSPALGCSPTYLDAMMQGTDTNPSYGMLWWLYGGAWAVVPGYRKGQEVVEHKVFGGVRLDRRIAPSAPLDAIGANGAGDQRLYVVPSHGLVIVRMGQAAADMNAAGGPFDEAFWSRMPDRFRVVA